MKLKDGFITYETDGEQIMVAAGPSADIFHGLVRSNVTAAFIVECLKNNTTFENIVDSMSKQFDAPREIIEKDTRQIITQLRSIGAIDE